MDAGRESPVRQDLSLLRHGVFDRMFPQIAATTLMKTDSKPGAIIALYLTFLFCTA
jgi:hypothetical protein